MGTPDPLPNWRQVPGFPVFGLGQPTEKGLSQVSGLGVKAQKAGVRSDFSRLFWILGCSQVSEALGRQIGQVEPEMKSGAAANRNFFGFKGFGEIYCVKVLSAANLFVKRQYDAMQGTVVKPFPKRSKLKPQ